LSLLTKNLCIGLNAETLNCRLSRSAEQPDYTPKSGMERRVVVCNFLTICAVRNAVDAGGDEIIEELRAIN